MPKYGRENVIVQNERNEKNYHTESSCVASSFVTRWESQTKAQAKQTRCDLHKRSICDPLRYVNCVDRFSSFAKGSVRPPNSVAIMATSYEKTTEENVKIYPN